MHNPVVKFQKSPSLDVDKYQVEWKKNGFPAGKVDVPKGQLADITNYSSTWSVANPTVLVNDGDKLEVNVFAVDGDGNISLTAGTASLDIPVIPPEPPTKVTLTFN